MKTIYNFLAFIFFKICLILVLIFFLLPISIFQTFLIIILGLRGYEIGFDEEGVRKFIKKK